MMVTSTPSPFDYEVITIVKVQDGDTFHAHLRKLSTELTSPGWRRTVIDASELPARIRLTNLSAPERKKPTKAEGDRAWHDLLVWMDSAASLMRVELWPDPNEGAFGRYLGDLYIEGHRDQTATQWMLSRGWNPWLTEAQRNAPRRVE